MDEDEVIERLNALSGDPEDAHSKADDLLLAALEACDMGAIADAFRAAEKRIGFWYA